MRLIISIIITSLLLIFLIYQIIVLGLERYYSVFTSHSILFSIIKPNMYLITKEWVTNNQRVVNALFFTYQVKPPDSKLVDNPYNGYIQLLDLALT